MATDAAPLTAAEPERLSVLVACEIRACMAREGVTGQELAARMNVSRTWVSRRINCLTAMTLDEVQVIAVALEVPVGTLLGPVIPGLPAGRGAA